MRFLCLILILTSSQTLMGQSKKLDLDDLTIKGELHSDDRLLILSRQKNELKNYIKFRTNFRKEISQEWPEYYQNEKSRPRNP